MNEYLKDNLILGDSLEIFFCWITLIFGSALVMFWKKEPMMFYHGVWEISESLQLC